MATEINVPSLGESVTEATVAKWLKQPGDAVARDEPLVELETDKVTLEVPAPAAGTLAEILPRKAPTCRSARCSARSRRERRSRQPLTPALSPRGEGESRPRARPRSERGSRAGEEGEGQPAALDRAGPAARKLVAEGGLDAATIAPTGPGDRIPKRM